MFARLRRMGSKRDLPTNATAPANATANASTAQRFEDKYECLEVLGTGKTSQVMRVRALQSPWYESAAKIVSKAYLTSEDRWHAMQEELAILQSVQHDSVLEVFDIFEDDDKFVIVTERAYGGELLDAICLNSRFPLRERDAAFVVRELLQVLVYLHGKRITHRDIKLSNILCRSDNFREGIVLIDFGLAHRSLPDHDADRDLTGMNGTCHYMAPEMFGRDNKYGRAIDIWAVGVIAFVLLFGEYPFDARFMSQIEDKIVAGAFEFPSTMLHEVSQDALDFVSSLLVRDPARRPTAAAALQLPWLQLDRCSPQSYSTERMNQLRHFYQERQNDNALLAVQPKSSSDATSTKASAFA